MRDSGYLINLGKRKKRGLKRQRNAGEPDDFSFFRKGPGRIRWTLSPSLFQKKKRKGGKGGGKNKEGREERGERGQLFHSLAPSSMKGEGGRKGQGRREVYGNKSVRTCFIYIGLPHHRGKWERGEKERKEKGTKKPSKPFLRRNLLSSGERE